MQRFSALYAALDRTASTNAKVAAMEAYFREAPAEDAAWTVFFLAGRRLLRGGSEQPLEPKAFGVLALLAGAPGRAFTRDEILDAVWGHRHVTPGVLNRVMTLLRHALGEEAHGARYLHTVHGVGYRFDLPEQEEGGAARSTQVSRAACNGATRGHISSSPERRARRLLLCARCSCPTDARASCCTKRCIGTSTPSAGARIRIR